MNDKGKGKVSAEASSSSTVVFNAVSPTPPLSEKSKAPPESKGKSKQEDEPLPGNFHSKVPRDMSSQISHRQSIPNLTPTRYVVSALNRFRLLTPPFRLLLPQILPPSYHSASASRAPENTHTASRAWPSISRENSTPVEPEI